MALDGRLDVAHNPPAVAEGAVAAEGHYDSIRRKQLAFVTHNDPLLQKDAEPWHKLVNNHLWVAVGASVWI